MSTNTDGLNKFWTVIFNSAHTLLNLYTTEKSFKQNCIAPSVQDITTTKTLLGICPLQSRLITTLLAKIASQYKILSYDSWNQFLSLGSYLDVRLTWLISGTCPRNITGQSAVFHSSGFWSTKTILLSMLCFDYWNTSLQMKSSSSGHHLLWTWPTPHPPIRQRREFCNGTLFSLINEKWPSTKIVHAKPRHPESKGSVERANREIKNALGSKMRDNSNDLCWVKYLNIVQYQNNTT